MNPTKGLTPAEWSQLFLFDDHWRMVQEGDDPLLVWELRKRGYLDALKQQPPLYRLSAEGRAALRWLR